MKIIVCCGPEKGKCVVYGDVDEVPRQGERCRVSNARLVIRFAQRSLFGVAAVGPVGDTRISAAVPFTDTPVVQEVLGLTDEAIAAIDAWPAYRA